METRHQSRRIDFWSSQTRGEFAPYGGPLELGAKCIRQHKRLCLSSLRRNLKLKVNKKFSDLNKKSLRVFEYWDFYVLSPISHLAIFVYLTTQHKHIWCQNLGISFMIWFTTGLPWFHGEDQRSDWEQLEIYFGAACSGDRRREWEKTQGPEKIRNKEKRPKTRRTNSAPPRKKKEKSPTLKREEEEKQRNSKRKKEGKKKGVKRKEKKRSNTTQLQGKKRHEEKKKNKKVFAHLRQS